MLQYIRWRALRELATLLVKLPGETKAEAVTQALRERLERVRRARSKRGLADDLDEIDLHCAALRIGDRRGAEEISISRETELKPVRAYGGALARGVHSRARAFSGKLFCA